MAGPAAHSNLGPSSAERWLNCPASVALAAAAPPQGSSAHAEEGTAAHWLAEIEARYRLINMDHSKREEDLGSWRHRNASRWDEDEIRRYITAYVDAVEAALDSSPGATLLLEQRMETGVPGVWGTGDAVVVSPTSVHVLDLKYGRGVPVEAEGNPQLRLYGLGALETFDGLLGDIETVSVTVVQPRLYSQSSETLTAAELREWRDAVVLPAVAEIQRGSERFGPGEKACRWCPVAGECRARRDALVAEDFSAEPQILTDEEIGAELSRVKQIRHWCDAVEAVGLSRIYSEGRHIPGFKVVLSGGRRTIPDAPAAIQALIDSGFSAEEVAIFKVKPLGALEKLVGPKGLTEILGDLIVKTTGKPSLVSDKDKRRAVTAASSAAEDFG